MIKYCKVGDFVKRFSRLTAAAIAFVDFVTEMMTKRTQNTAMLMRTMRKFAQRKMKIVRAPQVGVANFNFWNIQKKIIFRSWRWRVDDSPVGNRSESHLAVDARSQHSLASCHHVLPAQLQEGGAEAATESQGKIHFH